jgi:hypothetical protein
MTLEGEGKDDEGDENVITIAEATNTALWNDQERRSSCVGEQWNFFKKLPRNTTKIGCAEKIGLFYKVNFFYMYPIFVLTSLMCFIVMKFSHN